MKNDNEMILTKTGESRREAMLNLLVTDMRQLHRRRRLRRHVITTVVPILVVAIMAALWTARTDQPVSVERPSAGSFRTQVVRVQTDSSLLDRYRVTKVSQAEILTDDALITALAENNHTTGLIREATADGGRVWLTNKIAAGPAPGDGIESRNGG